MNDKNNRPRPMGLNIGSASIIMLFAVLCLTVLAALSLLSANSQYNLAERSAEVASSFYAAEVKAVQMLERVKSGDASGVDSYEENGETLYSYAIDIDEHQSLDVSVAVVGGVIEIRSWKIVESGDWTPDDFFNLWSEQDSQIVFSD